VALVALVALVVLAAAVAEADEPNLNLLILEDDESVARLLRQATEEAGYTSHVVEDGYEALEQGKSSDYDLLLLDVMVPRLNGFEITRRLREADVVTPILIITARDALEDKVKGLDAGADDYIVKPFELAELLARVRALLRRGNPIAGHLKVADLVLDTQTRQVTRGGVTVSLSATEFSLLEYLMRNAGRVLTRAMIVDHVWQYDFDGNDNVLDVYISYLRKKIDRASDSPLIQTIRGVGYRVADTRAT
jgi:DNA-binding response OmpR family regulator